MPGAAISGQFNKECTHSDQPSTAFAANCTEIRDCAWQTASTRLSGTPADTLISTLHCREWHSSNNNYKCLQQSVSLLHWTGSDYNDRCNKRSCCTYPHHCNNEPVRCLELCSLSGERKSLHFKWICTHPIFNESKKLCPKSCTSENLVFVEDWDIFCSVFFLHVITSPSVSQNGTSTFTLNMPKTFVARHGYDLRYYCSSLPATL